MSTEKVHITYITTILREEIAQQLLPEKILDFQVKHSGGLDGFMSALYTISIKTSNETGNTENTRELIAKFMKGDDSFRVASRSYIQFSNEVLIYSKVMPYYSKVISDAAVETIKVEDWIPKVYMAKYGQIEGLSADGETSSECVLVLENLKPKGYALGPKLYLDRDHMFAMMKPLAEYHAMSYVLKVQKDPTMDSLVQGIIPLPFIETEGTSNNFYDAIYTAAFDRFFGYFERSKETLISKDNPDDVTLERNLNKLKKKYGEHPTTLLEHIRTAHDDNDLKFAAILHGDFNRNNVLFRYISGSSVPADAKMIDFQELRYGTPCIDLSFAMYINMDYTIRDDFWMELLKFYHSNMFQTMEAVLGASGERPAALEDYSFDEFYKHFTKHAFYGVMICMHFLPWLCGTEEELSLLAMWFERDVFSKEFRQLSIEAGGDIANRKLFDIVKHANRMGYLDAL